MISDKELFELEHLLDIEELEQSRVELLAFTKRTMSNFSAGEFHLVYYTLLNMFAHGKIKKLMITMPPQHGKSQGSTRQLPAFIFGLDPDKKIVITSYNTTFARKFNRDIQRIIDTKEYNEIFPKTYLNESNVVTVSSSFLRNSEEFEIVNHKGSLKAVGRGGALTGASVDCVIMDDLYKDYAEGNSPLIRDNVWDWYISVVNSRLHNNSQQLIVFTRWHEDDLIGRLEKKEKVVEINSFNDLEGLYSDTWVKLNFEAIMTKEATDLDKRNIGEALWPDKHSLEKSSQTKYLDPEKFDCLYQGNPQNKTGLLYDTFKTYDKLPAIKKIKNYTDTADSGSDYLCSINYAEPLDSNDEFIYILDILFTQQPMEVTEPLTINLINNGNVNECMVESNNGGRSFARVIEKGVKASVKWHSQTGNKESRIYSQSATVNRRIVFPSNWHIKYTDFYDHVTKFKKVFKSNKHDDGVDVLTSIIEQQKISDVGIIW